MMNNWEIGIRATNEALNSQGSAMHEVDRRSESLEAKITEMKNQFTQLTMAVGNEVLTNGLFAMVGILTSIGKAGAWVAGGLGLIPVVLGTFALIIAVVSKNIRSYVAQSFSAKVSTREFAKSVLFGTGVTKGFGNALLFCAKAFRVMLIASAIGALITAVTWLMEKFITAVIDARKEQEKFKKSTEAIAEAYTVQKDKINDLIDAVQRYHNVKGKEKESTDAQNELANILPNLVDHYNAYGDAIIKTGKALELELQYTRELAKLNYKDKKDVVNKNVQKELDIIKEKQIALELLQNTERNNVPSPDVGVGFAPKIPDFNLIKAKMLALQKDIGNSNLKIKDDLAELADDFLKLNHIDLNGDLAKQVKDLVQSLDLSHIKKNTDVGLIIQNITSSVSSYNKMQKNGVTNASSYKAIIDSLKRLLKSLGIGKEGIKEFIDQLRNQEIATEDTAKATEMSSDRIAELAKVYDDSVSNISTLNKAIVELADNHNLSAETIGTLIAKYPELMQYMNDETTLREKMAGLIEDENNTALDSIGERLSYNEDYFTKVKNGNKDLIKDVAKGYIQDMSNVKTMTQFKEAMTDGLVKKLEGRWADYFDVTTMAFTEQGQAWLATMTYNEATHSKQLGAILDAQEKMKQITDAMRKSTKDMGFDKLDQSGLDDNNKKTKESIYVTDEFKESLDKVNASINEQENLLSKFPNYSKQYQKALQTEITLQEQKKKLIDDQTSSLEKQIKAGKIKQVGNISQKDDMSYSALPTSGKVNWNALGGKLKGTGGLMEKYANQYGISPALLGAIAMHETGNGTSQAITNKNNAFGIMGKGGLRTFSSVEESIKYTASLLAKNYIKKGLDTVAEIQPKYAPNGAKNDPHNLNSYWQKGVNGYMSQLGSGDKTTTPTSSKTSKTSKKTDNTSVIVDTTQEAIDKAKGDLWQLKSDSVEVQAKIEELQLESVKVPLYQGEHTIKQIDSQMKIYEAKQSTLDENSKEYQTNLQNQLILLKNKKAVLQGNLVYLEKELKTNKKLKEWQKQALQDQYLDLRNSLVDIDSSIVDKNKEKIQNIIDAELNKYKSEADNLDYGLSLEEEKAKHMKKDSKEYIQSLQDQSVWIKKKIQNVENEKKSIEKLLKMEGLDAKTKEDLRKQYKDLNLASVQLNNTLLDLSDTVKDQYNDIADKAIEAEKAYYEQKKKNSDDYYDNEMKKIQDAYDLQKKLIADAESKDDYDKNRKKLVQEEQDIQDQINKLKLDDSEEAKAKVIELEKQKSDKLAEIGDLDHKRQVDVRQDTLDTNQKNDEKAIDKDKETWDKYYDDIINNEKKWKDLREEILAGHVDAIKKSLAEMNLDVTTNMKTIGDSIQSNLLDKLEEATKAIQTVNGSADSVIKNAGGSTSNGGSTSGGGSSSSGGSTSGGSSGGGSSATGELTILKDINLWKRNGDKLVFSRVLHPNEVYRTYGEDSKFGGQYNVGNGYWVTKMKDYIKWKSTSSSGSGGGGGSKGSYASFDTGGYTGNSNGFAMLHEKELVLNKMDTKNLLDSVSIVRNLVGLLPKLNLPNITGSPSVISLNPNFYFEVNTKGDFDPKAVTRLVTEEMMNMLKPYGIIRR